MFSNLRKHGVVPVIAVDGVDTGVRLCEALLVGGLPVAEITFRTAAAAAVIAEVARRLPELILGAGTVLSATDMKRAADAGAKFAVAPGCNPRVLAAAREIGMPFAPGVMTPTDIETAVDHGMTTLKFFPAEAAGGVEMLKALIAPYRHLRLQYAPTGGITAQNLLQYLAIPEVAFVGGTWLAKKELIAAGDWPRITDLAREAVALAARRKP